MLFTRTNIQNKVCILYDDDDNDNNNSFTWKWVLKLCNDKSFSYSLSLSLYIYIYKENLWLKPCNAWDFHSYIYIYI